MTVTNLRKKDSIRTSINYRCVPGKQESSFAGLADLQNPPCPCVFDHSPLIRFQELYCFTNALGVGFWTITKAFFEFG